MVEIVPLAPPTIICPGRPGRAGSGGLCKPLLGVGGLSPELEVMLSRVCLWKALPCALAFLSTEVHCCPLGGWGRWLHGQALVQGKFSNLDLDW